MAFPDTHSTRGARRGREVLRVGPCPAGQQAAFWRPSGCFRTISCWHGGCWSLHQAALRECREVDPVRGTPEVPFTEHCSPGAWTQRPRQAPGRKAQRAPGLRAPPRCPPDSQSRPSVPSTHCPQGPQIPRLPKSPSCISVPVPEAGPGCCHLWLPADNLWLASAAGGAHVRQVPVGRDI